MQTVSCPNCGADVVFRSPALPVSVCIYCRTMVTRIGDELRNMGQAAVLPFDVSPIQIGTTGSFEGKPFEVIGRVRWGWSEGSWNEWLVQFGDMSHGWLGEAMGQFMVTRQIDFGEARGEAVEDIAAGRPARIGDRARIEGVDFQLADLREATCIAAEGELPFVAPAGWTIVNADFRSADGRLASLQRDHEEAALFTGRYVSLSELAPRNLRAITGWAQPRFAA